MGRAGEGGGEVFAISDAASTAFADLGSVDENDDGGKRDDALLLLLRANGPTRLTLITMKATRMARATTATAIPAAIAPMGAAGGFTLSPPPPTLLPFEGAEGTELGAIVDGDEAGTGESGIGSFILTGGSDTAGG